jgi:hypothetical protein
MKVVISEDYIGVYLMHSNDDGPYDAQEIVGWSVDEWAEDPETVVPAIANAIHLANTDPELLMETLSGVGK